ncbi:hypothetical protein [Seonamhaeicola sp. ML3]|uniref:hypothetical protein n=1 Tax=Seonamhaeicola sp. ML3 TaxID=2937786 RepID=UPI00200C62A6|nr:hypothetical protein [Seonamhaeicola sp. ML3]
MRTATKFIYIVPALCLLLTACLTEEDQSPVYNEELETLTALREDIETLADSSVCNDSSECRFIAFGSKPCGGPWGFLVYSTSIDTNDLEAKVEQYNTLEAAFNSKWGLASDCSVPAQPTDVICENNKCVAIY